MEKKVLIIDSDPLSRQMEESIVDSEEEMRIIACTGDGERGLNLIQTLMPDIVLSDLFLPGLDGFELMDKILSDYRITKKPRFLMVGLASDPAVVGQVLEYGASYYLIKPLRTASLQLALRRLCAMGSYTILADPEAPYRARKARPDRQTGLLLRRIGVPLHLSGYQFLLESVLLCVQDAGCLKMITKLIYPEVSRKYHTTPDRVERAMRHAIHVCWGKGDRVLLNELFGLPEERSERKPTNSEFIAVLSHRIREETKENYR